MTLTSVGESFQSVKFPFSCTAYVPMASPPFRIGAKGTSSSTFRTDPWIICSGPLLNLNWGSAAPRNVTLLIATMPVR